MYYVVAKKNPKQIGWELLTICWNRDDALRCRDSWQSIYPGWKVVVRGGHNNYRRDSSIYDDNYQERTSYA